MFDKLIASEPEGADFKNRRSYFMVSSLVVGVLFVTAVVISIFAADIGLGKESFELVEMIAPPDMTRDEPEAPQPQTAQSRNQTESQMPIRQANIDRVADSRLVPTEVSTVPNTMLERPPGPFIPGDRDATPSNGSGRDISGNATSGAGLSDAGPQIADNQPEIEPPPIKRDPPASKTPVTQSLGVINGRAAYLPKPIYSAAAIAIHAGGKVDVQVMIDETGKVISANVISGHPLLRANAEQAARNARFTPTLLSGVPVKVTGVIVYNFIR